MPKKENKKAVVQCPDCKTKFVRDKAEKEICGVCGTGKRVQMKDTKERVIS